MDRVVVLGAPGSGKTTTARLIASRLGMPHIELDSIYWLAGWTERDPDDFRARVDEVTSGPRWALDGNYMSKTASVTWPRADTIVWLDLPRRTTARRVLLRWLRRSIARTELWSGNRERLGHVRDPDFIVRWAWVHHVGYQRYEAMMDERWVRLRSPRQVRRWLRTL